MSEIELSVYWRYLVTRENNILPNREALGHVQNNNVVLSEKVHNNETSKRKSTNILINNGITNINNSFTSTTYDNIVNEIQLSKKRNSLSLARNV